MKFLKTSWTGRDAKSSNSARMKATGSLALLLNVTVDAMNWQRE